MKVTMKEELEEILDTTWAGEDIFYFPTIDSTNVKAKQLAAEGCSHGALILAGHQEVGRGRRGRSWENPKGTAIAMTLVLRPKIETGNASMLTLVAALAVASALTEETGKTAEIKWPNDIVMHGKKICGILTEMGLQGTKIDYVVVGMGINVHNTDFPDEISEKATSLYLETGTHWKRAKLVAAVLKKFEHYYKIFEKTEELTELAEEYNLRLVNRGRQVRVLDEKNPFEGTAVGITSTGELRVAAEDGEKLVSAGEVSVRGIYGYV